MKSSATLKFWEAFNSLPQTVQHTARKQYDLWQSNPQHPSLQFKPIGELWSVRVTHDYRALAFVENDTYYWFWIGTHVHYNRILRMQ